MTLIAIANISDFLAIMVRLKADRSDQAPLPVINLQTLLCGAANSSPERIRIGMAKTNPSTGNSKNPARTNSKPTGNKIKPRVLLDILSLVQLS
jgi:hypothetical protein